MRLVRTAVLLVVSAGWLAVAASAGAAVPSIDIGAASGPLTHVAVGNDLSCQVQHTGDTVLEFYPSSATPGDCGTFLAVGGTLFAPDFGNHDRTATSSIGTNTPFTASGQTGKTGAGTSSNPFKVVTNANAGATGLSLSQTDSYITGQESYRTDIVVHNGGGAPQSIILFRAGDCFLQESDRGFGFAGPNGAVGCSATANNTPAGRIEEWVPITGGANFFESTYSDVWSKIGAQAAFPNLCSSCTVQVDNGSGISWSMTINPGQSVTFSHYTTFSPTGRAGPPPPTTDDLNAARTPNCISVPSVVRNRVQRVTGAGTLTLRTRQVDNPTKPLRLSVSHTGRGGIGSIVYTVNGAPSTGNVLITQLKIGGRFRNKVTATVQLTDGRRVQLTQFLVILKCHVPAVACTRLSGNKQLRCSSRTPLSGRRVSFTVTQSRSLTASGSASVSRGRYTGIARSRNVLPAGVYAYKAVVRTNRPSVKFQMLRLVTVR